jgi:hypothetical protein
MLMLLFHKIQEKVAAWLKKEYLQLRLHQLIQDGLGVLTLLSLSPRHVSIPTG